MTTEPTNARTSFGDIAPELAEITDKVLFGQVWANGALSPRDLGVYCLAARAVNILMLSLADVGDAGAVERLADA